MYILHTIFNTLTFFSQGPIRFLLPAFFWIVLIKITFSEWNKKKERRDFWIINAAVIGLSNELILLSNETGLLNIAIPSFNFDYIIPPLTHCLSTLSGLIIGYSFMRYFLPWKKGIRIFGLTGGIGTLLQYIIITIFWVYYLHSYSGDFNSFWGETLFQLSAIIILLIITGSLIAGKVKGYPVPVILIFAIFFFFANDCLMIIPIHDSELHKNIFTPIEHNLQIWGVLFFIALYWQELYRSLTESEWKHRMLIDNSRDIIYSFSIDGVFTFVSPAWTILLGHPVNKIVGKPFHDFVHPDDIPKYTAWFYKVISTDRQQDEIEYRIQNINGTWLWHTTGAISRRDNNGKVIGGYGTSRDISERKTAENALSVSEEKYRRIVETAIEGIISLDKNFHITFANQQMASMLGYTVDEFLGKNFEAFLPEDQLEDHKTQIENRKQGKDAVYERCFQKKNGEQHWVLISAKTLTDATGSFEGSFAMLTDITERKKAEFALRKMNDELNRYFTLSLDLLCIADIDGHFIRLNPEWERALGYSIQELEGKLFIDFVHPDDLQSTLESVKKLSANEQILSFENRYRRKDGSYCWIEWRSQPSENFIYAVARDITKRKTIESKLKENEAKLSALFGSMAEMVALHELIFNDQGEIIDYRITDCNNAFTDITGIKKEDAIGKTATELYKMESAPYLDTYARVACTGESFSYTTYFEPMDKHFAISVVSPKKNHFATITTDITAIKRIQEVISLKNKELENYLYIASHDLRSPLVNIQGFSQRLQKQINSIKNFIAEHILSPEIKADITAITDEGIPRTLNFILSNVSKMESLLNGLLNLSRTGRTSMTIKMVDINHLLKIIIDAFNFQLSEINAIVTVDDLPACYGDEDLLNQLFSNIIGNSIKYREKSRQLIIEITAHTEFNKIIYSVKDNGIGINEANRDKIWDLFYRVDPASQDAGEGLGLSIVKIITERHKGTIRVESEPGKGCRFIIELYKIKFDV